MEKFCSISGIQGVNECIDGSHIEILGPLENEPLYYNRNKYNVHTCVWSRTWVNNQRLFEKSDSYLDITNHTIHFAGDSYLIGDLAYKVTPYMIVGFKDNGNLTRPQKIFNTMLSETREVVEHFIGLLEGRFRRLKGMDTQRLALVCLLVLSACILHNICILNKDMAPDIVDIEREVERERRLNLLVPHPEGILNQTAVAKRRRIMDDLRLL